MKNLFLLFVAFLFLQFTTLAQDGWFWQNPLPQGNSLNDFHIIDENNIAAFGMGVIVRTTDGGNNWNVKNINMTIKSVSFIDDLTGWASGFDSDEEGIVLKTTDGGDNWEIKKNESYEVNDVFFINSHTGWAVSGPLSAEGKIIKTTDGGESWLTQHTITDHGLTSLFFIDAVLGWAVGFSGEVLKTTDGGNNWVEQNSGVYASLLSLYFIDDEIGWIVGSHGTVLKTTNGGTNWFQQTPFIDSGALQSVVFVDSNVGWAVGVGTDYISSFGGYIMNTMDGGTNWNVQFATIPSGFRCVLPIDENLVWAVGMDGMILKTSNGGNVWNEVSSGTRNFFSSVQFIDENTGWAVGEIATGAGGWVITPERHDSTIILKTTNGGDDWFPQYSNIYEFFKSAYFTDINTGWAVGGYSGTGSAIIYNTTNGGIDWDEQFISSSHNNYTSVYFVDNNTGWVAGGNGLILKTTNGGEDWLSYSTGTEHGLASIFFTDNLNGWVVGNIWNDDDFRIFNTTDGGETWVTQFISIYYLFDLFFIDSNNGWVVGCYNINPNQVGAVLKTTNGGDDWVVQEISSTHQFTSVYFTDLNNGWANGTELIRTTNGGDDWFIASSPTYSWGNNSVFFINETTGWIVGLGGAILKTTNGGVSFVEENEIYKIPSDYYLSNNYPNPFNPSTKIKYSIPQLSNVVIKVFDILGNEIETLINEEKPAGTYKINWNAANLPSGVYFYRLQAGSFVETKKMVLLR